MMIDPAHTASSFEQGSLAAMSALAVPVAERLGFEPAQARRVWLAARVHDAVTAQPARGSRLDPLRPTWAGVRGHLLRIAQGRAAHELEVRPIEPMLAAHHEHWDGSGHPHGLRAGEISLGARVLGALEVYARLANWAKGPGAYARALRGLEAMAGAALDPSVVDAVGATLRTDERFCVTRLAREATSRFPPGALSLGTSAAWK